MKKKNYRNKGKNKSKNKSKDKSKDKREGNKFSDILISKKTFMILLILVIILGSVSLAKAKGWLIVGQPDVKIKDGAIKLDSLNLRQKILNLDKKLLKWL